MLNIKSRFAICYVDRSVVVFIEIYVSLQLQNALIPINDDLSCSGNGVFSNVNFPYLLSINVIPLMVNDMYVSC